MNAPLAQWLERWSYEPSVEGSTPSSRRLNFFFFTTRNPTLYFIFYFLLPKIFLFFIFYFLQLGIPTLFYFLIFRKLEIIITIQETKTAPGSSRKVLQRGLCRYSCTTQLHRWPSKLNRSLRSSCTCRYNAAAAGGGAGGVLVEAGTYSLPVVALYSSLRRRSSCTAAAVSVLRS